MAPRVAPYRLRELALELRELVEDYELDGNGDGALDAGDVEALRAFSPRPGTWKAHAKEQLLEVASGEAAPLFVPRTEAADRRIRAVTQRPAVQGVATDGERSPLDVSAAEIRDLFSDVSPASLTVGERELLLRALLDDAWVAPVDLWDFGLVAEGQEELVTRIVESTPERHKGELASRLVRGLDGGLYGVLLERVNAPDRARRVHAALAPYLLRAVLEAEESVAVGGIEATARRVSVERARTDDAVARASRYLGRELFPFGGPCQGLSYRAASGRGERLGPVELRLHRRDGSTVALGTIDPRRYETSDLLFKAILDRFHEQFYGASGRLVVPEPWANLAADLLPAAVEHGGPPGRRVLPLMVWTELPDALGRGGQRAFELPTAALAALAGLDAASPQAAVIEALVGRLRALGVEAPNVRPSPQRPGNVRLDPPDAKLLLWARAFAAQPQARELAPVGWELLRVIDGAMTAVIPLASAAHLDQVTLPKGSRTTPETVRDAVNARMARFGLGESARVVSVDGRPALTLAPEHLRLLLRAARFDFRPKAESLDTGNLYWSLRFADLAYLDFTTQRSEIAATLERWGFDRFELVEANGSEVLVAGNGELVMVACRGTQGLGDVVTDLLGQRTSGRGGASAEGSGTTAQVQLADRVVGGRRVRLHSGFAGQVAAVRARVLDAVRRFGGGTLPVWVTGQSKGGAEAAILALSLQTAGVPVAGGYTFNAPRAGDEAFARLAVDSGLAQRWYNFQHPKDPVSHLPTRLRGFQNFGTILWPDRFSGRPTWGQSASERLAVAATALATGEAISAHLFAELYDTVERAYFDTQWTPPGDEPVIE